MHQARCPPESGTEAVPPAVVLLLLVDYFSIGTDANCPEIGPTLSKFLPEIEARFLVPTE